MQQNPPPSSLIAVLHDLLPVANLLAIPLTGFFGYLFGKRRQSADLAHVNAETHKIEAETHQINSAIATRAWERLDDLECIIADLRTERRQNQEKVEDWEMRYGLLEIQMRKAISTLQANQIPWDEKA